MSACNSSIDWVATGAMLQGIGTIIGAIAVIATAAIGATNFAGWRRQQITMRRMDRAEAILGSAYEARSALSEVRYPMMFSNEQSAAEAFLLGHPIFDGASAAKREKLITCQAYYERLKRTSPQRNKLYALEPVARAIFGDDLANAMEKLAHQFRVVQVDVDSYVDDDGQDAEFSKQIDASMCERPGNDQSVVGLDTATAVEQVKTVCVPILRMNP